MSENQEHLLAFAEYAWSFPCYVLASGIGGPAEYLGERCDGLPYAFVFTDADLAQRMAEWAEREKSVALTIQEIPGTGDLRRLLLVLEKAGLDVRADVDPKTRVGCRLSTALMLDRIGRREP